MDVTAGTFTNKADATLKLDTNGQEEKEDPQEQPTTQNFKKEVNKYMVSFSYNDETFGKVNKTQRFYHLTEKESDYSAEGRFD